MGIKIYTPQFRDSSISTMLRTNPDELIIFTTDDDSAIGNELVVSDSQVIDQQENLSTKIETSIVVQDIKLNENPGTSEVLSVDSGYYFDWGNFHTLTTAKKKSYSLQKILSHSDYLAPEGIVSDSVIIIDWVNFPVYRGPNKIDLIQKDTFFVDSINGSNPQKNINNNNGFADWMTVSIIIILFVAGWIRFNFPKQLSQIFKGFLSFRQSTRLFNEQNSLQQRISNVLNLLFFLVSAVFISQLLKYYDLSFLGLNHFYSSIVVSLLYTAGVYFKALIYKTLGYLFDAGNITSEYIHNSFVINKVLALTVLPVLVAIPFVPDGITEIFIYSGVFLYTVFYLFKILRGFQIIILRNQSLYFSFLYLCALEIVPILIINKIISLFL